MTPTPTPPPPPDTLQASTVRVPAPLPPPAKKKLTELSKFPQALDQIYQTIFQRTVSSELQVVLSRIFNDFHAANERKRIINLLGEELYDAFFSDIVYELTYEAKAYQFYVLNLKKRCLRSIIRNGKRQ